MTILQAHNILNFWINKRNGDYFPPSELDALIDRGSIALFSDLRPKWATSQYIKDALAPFKITWPFTTASTISGYLPVPASLKFLSLASVDIEFGISGQTRYYSVPFPNDDERSNRLNSQIDPVTATSPIGEVIAPGLYKLHPLQGYTGNVIFLRRPVPPVFAYTTISERIIVYDEAASVQIEWPEDWQDTVLIKALQSIGISLNDQQISQFAEIKSQQNYMGVNKI